MPEDELRTPRLNVDMPLDLHDRLREKLPGRTKSDAVRALLEILLVSMDEEGGGLLYDVLQHRARIVSIGDDEDG